MWLLITLKNMYYTRKIQQHYPQTYITLYKQKPCGYCRKSSALSLFRKSLNNALKKLHYLSLICIHLLNVNISMAFDNLHAIIRLLFVPFALNIQWIERRAGPWLLRQGHVKLQMYFIFQLFTQNLTVKIIFELWWL